MMFIDACGAKSAILSTSSGFSSRPSIFTMSFLPCFLLGTFMAIVTTPLYASVMFRIFATFMACPAAMWSMTVPFLIFATYSIFLGIVFSLSFLDFCHFLTKRVIYKLFVFLSGVWFGI
jgi:hypothetical protein